MVSNPKLYQLVVSGSPDERAKIIEQLAKEQLRNLGIEYEAIAIFSETQIGDTDPHLPTIAVFLGYQGAQAKDHPALKKLLDDSQMIITVVSDLQKVSNEIPEELRHINAIAADGSNKTLVRVASLILEGFRLLRKERRLFISYRRTESQAVADQLYDALDARGFDVFIDTRAVPPGVDFQAELWHRLSDSDVVVLIDTADFRSSRWTVEELARANATNIQILHLLWPGQPEDSTSAFSYFHALSASDFEIASGTSAQHKLYKKAVEDICYHAEKLRARAIAARYRYLVDSFCDAARDRGLTPSVQPERWISVGLPNGKQLAVVPTIGIPTSDRINAVFSSLESSGGGSGGTWVLYDNRGVLNTWLEHLNWLDGYLPAKSVSMVSADQQLKKVAT